MFDHFYQFPVGKPAFQTAQRGDIQTPEFPAANLDMHMPRLVIAFPPCQDVAAAANLAHISSDALRFQRAVVPVAAAVNCQRKQDSGEDGEWFAVRSFHACSFSFVPDGAEPRSTRATLREAPPAVQPPFATHFRICNDIAGSLRGVPAKLEAQLGKFLRARRGEMTYAQFSRKLGVPPSTLHRLEQGAQSITLPGLQQIMRRLKCGLPDIFGEHYRD